MKDSKNVKIMLNMIIKNEEKIIIRCLDRLLPWIDGVCICDTGSTDHTLPIVEEWKKNVFHNPHTFIVVEEAWKNFGHNRTRAIHHAQHFISSFSNPEKEEWYLLFVDADMELTIDEDDNTHTITHFKESILPTADIWYTTQKGSTLSYSNIRWVKATCEIECVGPTHEYYEVRNNRPSSTTPPWIYIQDRGDGGSKADKFTRDVTLLSDALKENPLNRRHWFYLANSFRDSNLLEQATLAYEQRIRLEGWKDEIYMSHIFLGDTLARMNEKEEYESRLVQSWLNAYHINPHRVEALYRLCHYYRMKQKYYTALLFYDTGVNIPRPSSSQTLPLFYERTIHEYLWNVEMSILGFYTDRKEQGKKACQEILLSGKVPDTIMEMTKKNLQFYNSI
jgi:glycosyltransferase involved in cell wall biosynthesis